MAETDLQSQKVISGKTSSMNTDFCCRVVNKSFHAGKPEVLILIRAAIGQPGCLEAMPLLIF